MNVFSMAKNYKQPSSLLTRCFRSAKTISTSETISNLDATTMTSLTNACPLTSVKESIQTIDQMVQQGDSHCIQKTMNIEQIEEMLIKWTHIAHFLVDAYQQIQTSND
jgi:hypothetical protein